MMELKQTGEITMDYEEKLKELHDNAEKFKNAYIKCMGAIEFIQSEQKNAEESKKKDK